MPVRNYQNSDYKKLISLYKLGETFGGQYDPARDSEEKINTVIANDPESILVYEESGEILGSVSLIENGRVAWLFRYAVATDDNANVIAHALYKKAVDILKGRGHSQVLVYSDPNNEALNNRYAKLGMTSGNVFRCFWEEI